MSDQLIGDLATIAPLAVLTSIAAGCLINELRRKEREPVAILVMGVCFCAALDLLLTFVNALPRP